MSSTAAKTRGSTLSSPHLSRAGNRRGILAMLAAMSVFTSSDTIMKIATAHLPTGQIMATRGAFAVLIVIGLIAWRREWHHIRSVATPKILARAGMEALTAFLFILCLAAMPLANITAVLQATPMILTLLAVMVGIEKVGWRRWAAIVFGFVGVLLIVKPSPSGFNVYAALTLLIAALVAVRDLVTRTIGPHIPASLVTLTTTVAVTVSGFLLGSVEDWVSLSGIQILMLAGAALFVSIGNLAVVTALRSGELSVVSPFRYSVILTSLLAGFLVFGEWPDLVSCAGIALIVLSGLYTIRREQNRARSAARELEDAP